MTDVAEIAKGHADREACETCRFFGEQARLSGASSRIGSCRRYAPRGPVVDHSTATNIDYFPPVRKDDWCGEYQPATLADAEG